MPNTLIFLAEAAAHESEGPNPWVIGAIALGILMALLWGVVSFGGGREHS